VKLLEELLFLIDDEQLVAADRLLSVLEAPPHASHPVVAKALAKRRPQLDTLRADAAAVRRAKVEFEDDDDWTFVQKFRGITTCFKQVGFDEGSAAAGCVHVGEAWVYSEG
jgi:hypothetical protein